MLVMYSDTDGKAIMEVHHILKDETDAGHPMIAMYGFDNLTIYCNEPGIFAEYDNILQHLLDDCRIDLSNFKFVYDEESIDDIANGEPEDEDDDD